MTNTSACPQCGGAIPGHSAAWLCPKCLLRQAVTPPDLSDPAGLDMSAPPAIHYFGDYELLHEIARGGMGVVYKARQVSLNRTVAVKVLLFGKLAGADFVKRFRAEAEAAASLQHPNIVAIHEVGEHEGQQYFSMDYIEGPDLAAIVRDQLLPARRAAAYLKIIAEAIHYAHQRGVLHRDLKPSNVLIDTNDQPRITDFGLAKRLESNADLTVTGQMLGTPHYMPPEQAGGKRDQLGAHSDVYSLGAIFYHLLTGRPPFLADTLEAALSQLLHNDPVAPRLLNTGIPPDLETICLKCLNKTPARRYQSALALAEDLNRWLSDEPILARPISALERVVRWCHRKPALALLLVALLAVGAAGFVGILSQWRRAQTNASVATANLRESYIAQAQALRLSSKVGRRFEALEALTRAAVIRPSVEIRNEAIANLAQADLRAARIYSVPSELSSNETFDPSFTLSATCTKAGPIEVVKAFSREPFASIRLTRGSASWVRKFSSDQRYLALVASRDGTCVWDFARQTFVLSGLPGDTLGDFGPNNDLFAIRNHQGSISVFNLDTGTEWRRIKREGSTDGVTFDPSGQKLACWNYDRLDILDADTSELIHSLPPKGYYGRVVWSADGQLIAAAGTDHQTYLWNAATGKLINLFLGHSEEAVALALSPASDFIAVSSFDQTTRVWEVLTGRPLVNVTGSSWNLAFSSNNRYLGPVHLGNSNCIYEVVRPVGFRRLAPPVPATGVQKVHGIDFSHDGRLLASAAWDGVRLWDRSTERFLAYLPARDACTVLFEPDFSALLISASGELSRWPLRYEHDQLLIGPRQPTGMGGSWDFARLEARTATLAVASAQRRGAITNLRSLTNWVRLQEVHWGGAAYIDLSPDGRFAATGTWGGSGVWVWDARTGKLLHKHPTQGHAAVAFSPDGRWLIAGGSECHALTVGAWTNIHVVRPLTGERILGTLAFSPDSRLLALFRSNTSFELIEPGTWRSVAILQSPHAIGLCWPRFSPDGTLLAAADTALGVQIWDLREIRSALRAMGLDWDHPPYRPSVSSPPPQPLVARVLDR